VETTALSGSGISLMARVLHARSFLVAERGEWMSRSDALKQAIAGDARLKVAQETVVIAHEVASSRGWVLAAEFDGRGPKDRSTIRRRTHRYQGLYVIYSNGATWSIEATSVGGAGASTKRSRVWSRSGGFGDVFGGWVADPRGVSVRRTDRNGRTVVGEVTNGVAILTWAPGTFGEIATTELFDAAGELIVCDAAAHLSPPSR
jgi:hypothetical protein